MTEAEFQEWAVGHRSQATVQSQRRPTRMSSLLATEREARRLNYFGTEEGSVRENLRTRPGWTAARRELRDLSSSEESDDDLEGMSTAAPNNDIGARRDLQRLERALQNYRSARNALRTGRTSELGAVPTASALRAYWNEEPNEQETTARTSNLSGLPSQYRLGRQRRHAEHIRLHAGRERRAPEVESRLTTRKERQKSEAFERVQNSIRYLSQLRHTGVEGGLDLARQLDLDSLYESEEANIPSDLPMHVNSLPIPQYSSWLEPGMVWHGLQSTDREPLRTTATWASQVRRERQRDLFRRTLARRREMVLGNFHQESESLSGPLVDAERYLSDLLQGSNGRWGSPQLPPSSPLRTAPSPQPTEWDHWPVKVTIHSVDMNAMTLTGTMSASHMPEKLSTLHQSPSPPNPSPTSMSSFFTGEIIDFRQQPLETEAEGRDYRVGGLDIDASYWARLGPFRQEIEKVRNLRGKKRSEYQQDSRLWEAFRKAAGGEGDKDLQGFSGTPTPPTERIDTRMLPSGDNRYMASNYDGEPPVETEESKEVEDDEVMARSLGSAKWIQEKLGREWILMRWKERCFVSPTEPSSDSNQSRTILTTTSFTSLTPDARLPGSQGGTSWGLTISGFYYIALNRITGEIDGLYYDPGSQPYQALRMVPEGISMRGPGSGSTTLGISGRAPIPSSSPDGMSCACGCGEPNCQERVGLKKWFPSLEFR